MGRTDPCCSRCRTPSGVCATGHACDHHRGRVELGPSPITYRDPTGNEAIYNLEREEREARIRRQSIGLVQRR
jgi:hypothetical protein